MGHEICSALTFYEASSRAMGHNYTPLEQTIYLPLHVSFLILCISEMYGGLLLKHLFRTDNDCLCLEHVQNTALSFYEVNSRVFLLCHIALPLCLLVQVAHIFAKFAVSQRFF